MAHSPYANVGFVTTTDPGFRQQGRWFAERRPTYRGAPSMGSDAGARVEELARRMLSGVVALQEARILRWQQIGLDGRYAYRYREIDAVAAPEPGACCLYEVKLTTPAHMADARGMRQLNAAARVLESGSCMRAVRRRLVYISDDRVQVGNDIPVVRASDLHAEVGVIWLRPRDIMAAAVHTGIQLPDGWRCPEARKAERSPAASDRCCTAGAGHAAPSNGPIPGAGAMAMAFMRAMA